MDVGNVRGPGGIDRNQPRHQRVDGGGSLHAGKAGADRASISDDGRDYLAAVDELTEQARQDDPARAGKVAEAEASLQRGDLDRNEVFLDTADVILRGDEGLADY